MSYTVVLVDVVREEVLAAQATGVRPTLDALDAWRERHAMTTAGDRPVGNLRTLVL